MALMLLSMSFCVTEEYPLIVKIDPYKDGCYLKRIFVVGRTRSLSLSLSLLCLCSENILMHVLTFILQYVDILTL